MDPGEKEAILEARSARRGKRWAVDFRQWRRIDVAGWPKTQEMGSPHLQEMFMHRVSVIVHCVAVIEHNHNRNRVSLYYCFRKINHLVLITICIHPLMYGKLCRAYIQYQVQKLSFSYPVRHWYFLLDIGISTSYWRRIFLSSEIVFVKSFKNSGCCVDLDLPGALLPSLSYLPNMPA